MPKLPFPLHQACTIGVTSHWVRPGQTLSTWVAATGEERGRREWSRHAADGCATLLAQLLPRGARYPVGRDAVRVDPQRAAELRVCERQRRNGERRTHEAERDGEAQQ